MRLTKTSDSFGGMVWFRSQDKNDLWLEPCEMTAHDSRRAIDELAAYEDAEEHGLLVRLPCKVGDTVYRVALLRVDVCGYRMELECEATVEAVPFQIGMVDAIGKTVYLTREEAEAVLSELDEWYEMYPESDVAREALALAKRAIRKIHSADVAPVRHGWWIKDGDEGPVYCSECGEEHEWEDYRASYCDCCGAKMDMDGDCNDAASR